MTLEQTRELGRVLGMCRSLYSTALEQRITAYRRAGVSLSPYQQEAELKDLRGAFPEYAAIHSPGQFGPTQIDLPIFLGQWQQ